MKIEQLQYFKAVAETNNMTEAARQMFVTPAAISIAVSKLEQELGVQLFDRTTISVTLNAAGKIYYNTVVEVLQRLEEAGEVLRGGSLVRQVKSIPGNAPRTQAVIRVIANNRACCNEKNAVRPKSL